MKLVGYLATIALLTAGCGGGSPSGPSSTVQVGGVWSTTSTIASVTGGECFAGTFQSLVGSRGTGTIQIDQNGSTLSARHTDNATGGSCDYTGTAGAGSVALNTVSCTASDAIGATCPNGAGTRNIRLQTGGVSASVSGRTMTGTVAETYNVTTSGGTALGTLVVNYTFSATKQ